MNNSKPGGAEAIAPHAGKDVTALFNILHANDTLKKILSQITVVGSLDPKSQIEVVKAAEDEDELEARRDALPPSNLVVNLAEFESLAIDRKSVV